MRNGPSLKEIPRSARVSPFFLGPFPEPSPKDQKADDIDPEKPPDDTVDHHHGKERVDGDQIDMNGKKDQNEGKKKPHEQPVEPHAFEIGFSRTGV
jgi:hypothetical protein